MLSDLEQLVHRLCLSTPEKASEAKEAAAPPPVPAPGLNWARGTGYSTEDDGEWDLEAWEAAQRGKIKANQEMLGQIASLLRCHRGQDPSAPSPFPPDAALTLGGSRLVPVLESYLCNDSLVELAEHADVYRAVFGLVRALCLHPALVPLLSSTPLAGMISRLASASRPIAAAFARGRQHEPQAEADGGGGEELQLALEILAMEEEVLQALSQAREGQQGEEGGGVGLDREAPGPDKVYSSHLGPLQFLEVPSFSSHISAQSARGSLNKRAMMETASWLSGALPLCPSSSIFLRRSESDMTQLKALIVGPEGTPYSGGCFEFQIGLPSSYPDSPPQVQLMTTGGGSVRFNPNLYSNGKVCLSLLGTWQGGRGEGWTRSSTLLQVVISIQSLILVEEPLFNEPGNESMEPEVAATHCRAYNADLRLQTVKFAMVDMIKNPPEAFEEVVRKHFFLRKEEILSQCAAWERDLEDYEPTEGEYEVPCHDKSHLIQQMKEANQELREVLGSLEI